MLSGCYILRNATDTAHLTIAVFIRLALPRRAVARLRRRYIDICGGFRQSSAAVLAKVIRCRCREAAFRTNHLYRGGTGHGGHETLTKITKLSLIFRVFRLTSWPSCPRPLPIPSL